VPARRGRGARRAAAALLALFLLTAAGCATAPPAQPAAAPIPPGRAVELAQRWAAEWAGFPGLRAAIDLTAKNRRQSERVAALVLLAPTALRVEVATPFGLPALVATANPDEIMIFRVLERRAQTTHPTPEAVERWLGVPVPPLTLIRLLAGNVPTPADPQAITVEGAPSPHLAWTDNGVRHRVWVSAEGRPARLLLERAAEDSDRLVTDFEWGVAGGGLAAVRVEAPAKGAELTVRYLSVEYRENPPEAFRLALPADIPIQRLD
jgi:hypothetical protein